MKHEYKIISGGKKVGSAVIIAVGLYYDINCKCSLKDGITRIFANCANKRESIGICVPVNGEMVLHTKIPQKRLQALLGFEAVWGSQEEWIPLMEGEPIGCLHKIANARFQIRNGKPGLSIQQVRPGKDLQE